jgi:hypothetical protein
MPIPVTVVTSTLVTTGCATSPRRATYDTLATIGAAVDKSMKMYSDAVLAGRITPEQREKVRAIKNQYNQIYVTACNAAAFDYGIKNQYNQIYVTACNAAAFDYGTAAPEDLINIKNELLDLIVVLITN